MNEVKFKFTPNNKKIDICALRELFLELKVYEQFNYF